MMLICVSVFTDMKKNVSKMLVINYLQSTIRAVNPIEETSELRPHNQQLTNN